MEYKLIAMDMDDTALTTDKKLSEGTVKAINTAAAAGKQVVFCTGRNISIVTPYIDQVNGMKYAITASGAAVNDIVNSKRIYEKNLDSETVKWIISATAGTDCLPVMYIGDESYCPDWAAERAAEFHVPDFSDTYRKHMNNLDNVFQHYMENPVPVQKLNLLFRDELEASVVYEQIKFLPLCFTTRSKIFFEINAPGISKAKGLKRLCEHLGIMMEECIALGDAENDLEVIKAAGLGVAMGNAQMEIKEAADRIVGSCNEDGAAQAIYEFLL